MGDEIEITSKPQVSIQTSCSSHADEPIKILLIRNGELINEFGSESPNFQIKFQDDYFNSGETIYYRIMINAQSNSYQVISNPIFVKFAPTPAPTLSAGAGVGVPTSAGASEPRNKRRH